MKGVKYCLAVDLTQSHFLYIIQRKTKILKKLNLLQLCKIIIIIEPGSLISDIGRFENIMLIIISQCLLCNMSLVGKFS